MAQFKWKRKILTKFILNLEKQNDLAQIKEEQIDLILVPN